MYCIFYSHMTRFFQINQSNRTATKLEITKAYRKLAAELLHDRIGDGDKAKAEKMFINIAAAKEVLSDPGLLGGC